ncbi:MAG TPA: hypothetical protein IGS17_03090 [Oscillatoriales cyanobacterium M59_W2019_021]|nr:hypothetical protein [Oscillatoriales cyanobacterium M4454_W2019_049]HIK49898.1 hypothetical protein [Oscillatoriales cyanobacterium M59_W2019_021]
MVLLLILIAFRGWQFASGRSIYSSDFGSLGKSSGLAASCAIVHFKRKYPSSIRG